MHIDESAEDLVRYTSHAHGYLCGWMSAVKPSIRIKYLKMAEMGAIYDELRQIFGKEVLHQLLNRVDAHRFTRKFSNSDPKGLICSAHKMLDSARTVASGFAASSNPKRASAFNRLLNHIEPKLLSLLECYRDNY
jgi:hypothetical protein